MLLEKEFLINKINFRYLEVMCRILYKFVNIKCVKFFCATLQEKAFEATTASQAEIEKMRAAFTAEVEELQQKLIALEAERNELITKLKGSTTHHKYIYLLFAFFFVKF